MHEDTPPPEITSADWAATLPSVRMHVHVLVSQVELLQTQGIALQARVIDLEAHLKQNSSTSSKPPSSDPPSAPSRPPAPAKGKKRGGQKGHQGYHRSFVPSEDVSEYIVHRPSSCPHCQSHLTSDLPPVGSPLLHQVWDLPPIHPHVGEHQRMSVVCPGCERSVRAPLPQDVPRGAFGPQLPARIALLHGRYRLSMRETAASLNDLLAFPSSEGSVSHLCMTTSAALEVPTAEIERVVKQQQGATSDETGWKQAGKRCWLWVMTTAVATFFVVAPKRNRTALLDVLGDEWTGVVGSDRLCASPGLPLEQRHICWAQLKRNWTFFAERAGPVGTWGQAGLEQIEALVAVWYRARDGGITRAQLAVEMAPIKQAVWKVLDTGRDEVPWEKARGFCRDLRNRWSAVWTFVEVEGVEPTNTAAERALRPAVLWRKGSFGTHCEAGNLFVGRMLTVTATCRQQDRSLLGFLTDAVRAHTAGQTAPSLFATP